MVLIAGTMYRLKVMKKDNKFWKDDLTKASTARKRPPYKRGKRWECTVVKRKYVPIPEKEYQERLGHVWEILRDASKKTSKETFNP